MGHRTQIVNIIRTDLECLQGEQHLAVQALHNRWGYGKVMPLALMSKLNQLYSADMSHPSIYKDGDEFKKAVLNHIPTLNHLSFFDCRCTDYSELFQDERMDDMDEFIKECITPLLSAKRSDLTEIAGRFLDWFDNNDGVLFVVQTYKKGQFGLALDIRTFFYNYDYEHVGTDDTAVICGKILNLESYILPYKGAGRYLDKGVTTTRNAFLSLKPLYQDCYGKGLEIVDIWDDLDPDDCIFPKEF